MDKIVENQNQDIEKLRKSAQLVHDFYASLNDPKRDNLPMTLFRALASLTLEQAEQGVALERIRFTPKELREKALEIGALKKLKQEDSSDRISEWVCDNWKTLEKELEERKFDLHEFSKNEKYYPWIEKDESKGGNGKYSYYFLVARLFNEQEKAEIKQYPCPKNGIRYKQESLTNVPRLAQWIDGFVLQGWKRYAYILPILLILLSLIVFVWVLLMLGLYTEMSTVKWLTNLIVSLGIGSWALSSPLYRVISNRIVIAPEWMTSFKEKSSVQLELKKVRTDSETGKAIRELRLVIYSAKCPICEGRVEVEGGGIQFPFRLVGKCIESPREHIFSFDHVTRVGKLLII